MFEAPMDLAKARILLSNDDGIHARGLEVLERIAYALSDDVWVVAPDSEQSGASHSLTITRPLRIRRLSERRFAVDGTPTDAVLLAVHKLLGDRPPDLVLSGVNRGGNLGEDVTYSGTVAAAMEGTLLGVPSIAFSQLSAHDAPTKWATTEHFGADIVRRLTARGWGHNVLINVNVPDVAAAAVKGITVASLGRRKIGSLLEERRDPRGKPYYWITTQRDEDASREGTDLCVVSDGYIAITPLHLDLTHDDGLKALGDAFVDV
jgi:5'-nucleotidase